MGAGGRWFLLVVFMLGALFVGREARATEGGPFLVFDASAEGLPQTEIRAAVERELGKPLAPSSDTASGELSVAVDSERRLVVRYRTAKGATERILPMPSESADVPLIISLAAGNLARDQTAGLEAPKPVEPAPTTLAAWPKAAEPRDDSPTPSPPPRGPELKRHWVGIHVAQDIAWVGGSNVCDANLGQKSDNYACFYEGTTDQPFWHTPFPYKDAIETGPVLATTRVLVSYDFAIVPALSVGGRFGFAFGGGPPAGQEPTETPPGGSANLNLLPDHTLGTGGVAFAPLHAEFRGTLWFLPLGARPVSAYAGLGFGAAQVDSKTTVSEYDCANTLPQNNPDWNAAVDGTYDDCRKGSKNFNWKKLPETNVDAWKKMGQGFVAVNLGVLFPVEDLGGLVLNVNGMYMLPASGLVLEPSLGIVAAF